LIETFNREFVVQEMDRLVLIERGDDLLIDKCDFDDGTGRLHSERIVVRDGNVYWTRLYWRLYAPNELQSIMHALNFEDYAISAEGEQAFTSTSSRMLVAATRWVRAMNKEPLSTHALLAADEESTPWRQVVDHLGDSTATYWLAIVGPAGRPHVRPVLAVWVEGELYFCAGKATRKIKNLASTPECSLCVEREPVDLVVEGIA
jgi:hypothetical protein